MAMVQRFAKVTVIVVIRERASCSVTSLRMLMQTLPADVRVIFADGGLPESLEGPLDQLNRERPFERLRHPCFLTPNEARNLALETCINSDFMVFIDNDVFTEAGWLEAALDHADSEKADWVAPLTLTRKRTAAGLVENVHHAGGTSWLIRSNDVLVWAADHRGDGLDRHDEAISRMTPSCEHFEFHCVIGRGSAVRELHPFDETSDADDHYDLACRALLAGHHVSFCAKSVVAYDTSVRFTQDDVLFFAFRWGDVRVASCVEAFERRWGFDRRFLRSFQGEHVIRVVRHAFPDGYGGLDDDAIHEAIAGIERDLVSDPRFQGRNPDQIQGGLPPLRDRLLFALYLCRRTEAAGTFAAFAKSHERTGELKLARLVRRCASAFPLLPPQGLFERIITSLGLR
jgi:hypothetical protein